VGVILDDKKILCTLMYILFYLYKKNCLIKLCTAATDPSVMTVSWFVGSLYDIQLSVMMNIPHRNPLLKVLDFTEKLFLLKWL